MKGGELLDKYIGETERHIKELFDRSRKYFRETGTQPVLFIDEAEAIMPPRGSRRSSDVDLTIVPTFLSEMDGFEGHNPFIILATNYIEMLDPAVIRPGRIDIKIPIDRPTEQDCVDIFQIHLQRTKLNGNIEQLAKAASTHLFTHPRLVLEVSGAMVANIVNSAIEIAVLRAINKPKNDRGVTTADLINSINNL